jgi:dTMP kinase
MEKGIFIVVEGIDGAGKKTQCELLCERLQKEGCKSILTEEPTNGEIGKLIREYLKKDDLSPETLALLFAADRREHVKFIESSLSKNSTVISERYLFSSLAYQSSQGVDEKWIWEINKFAPLPDFVILLDLSPEIALERVRNSRDKREYFETLEFLQEVRKKYLEIFKKENPKLRGMKFFVVNAERPSDVISEEIWENLKRWLNLGTP